jgi:predicted  nucleic acid-binding Zn-ribbon protein
MSEDPDRTASLMTPAKLAQMKPKPAASPAAWLDQMASDAGHMHVRQLKALSTQLADQAAQRDYGPVAQSLAALADAMPRLDFTLLQPKGWLARATGKAKSAADEFIAQHERIAEAIKGVKQQSQSLLKASGGQVSATERTLVEFEVEWRAIEKILDQGARWLQDMRNQLKTRQAAVADAEAQRQIDEDAARCEILVQRLKKLRAVAAASQQAHQQAQSAAARRAALLQALQQLQSGELKAWEGRLAPVASAAEGGSTNLDLEEPAEAHQELQRRIGQLADDCRQVQVQEQALAAQLSALASELQSAA